ncbi:MAG TPA: hypothetical protein VGD31_10225 [Sphingobacteriaceae bacterium]
MPEETVTPPGNAPLIEGLDPSWNALVEYVPEDKRGEFANGLKERVSSYSALEPWKEFASQGITPELAKTSVDLYNIIERNPREVYETIGKHLNITPAQAKEVVQDLQDEVDEGDEDDPRIQRLQQQVDTLAQIALAKNQQELQSKAQEEANAKLEAELSAAKKKYGDDIPDEHLLMRMMHMNMSADEAAKDYRAHEEKIRARRPAPWVMGGSGNTVPNQKIDPTKLSGQDTRNLVAQMFQHAAAENKR